MNRNIWVFHRTITDWFSESILRSLLVERQAGTRVILDLETEMVTSGCRLVMTYQGYTAGELIASVVGRGTIIDRLTVFNSGNFSGSFFAYALKYGIYQNCTYSLSNLE